MPIRKVVVIGPESTGKSTLSAALAAHFGEPWVPEYARSYLDGLERPYQYEDLTEIAKGQLKLEDAKAKTANKLLICDTDLHVIKVWSEHKYGQTDPWIHQQIKNRVYDLYLLTDIDIPWEPDRQREHPSPEMRAYFFELYEKMVQNTGLPVKRIFGDWKKREQLAIKAINHLFRDST